MATIPRTETIEAYRAWRADNPLAEIWNFLLIYADHTYLRRNWKGPDDAIPEISTRIRQAHEYHLASGSVSLLTRPVLVYYSFLNLSKALLFILNEKRSSEYHGLCDSLMPDDLLAASGRVNEGVFKELVLSGKGQVLPNERITLKRMIENLLEMQFAYGDYFNAESSHVEAKVRSYIGGRLDVEVSLAAIRAMGHDDPETILRQRTFLHGDFDRDEARSDSETLTLTSKQEWKGESGTEDRRRVVSKHFTFSAFPNRGPHINLLDYDQRLPKIAAYFGAMWLLGELVRYSPSKVDSFLRNSASSREWFIRELCDTSERVFPNIVINQMTGVTHRFGSHL